MVKTHDREFFCKHVTASTAKKILQNLQVLWSSPLLFNDPFDTQFDLNFGFSLDELPATFLKEVEKLVFGNDDPKCNPTHPLCFLILMLRGKRTQISRNKFVTQFRDAMEEGTNNVKKLLEEEHHRWRDYLRHTRVFCVAEDHDNLLMWAHYTDCHHGAVFRFKCLPEYDTALCAARAITYRPDIPVIATMEDWIRHCTGQIELDFDRLFYDLAFTKSDHWSYEKEWRCYTRRESAGGALYELMEILPGEIHSIYLGCKIGDSDRNDIMALLGGQLSHVEVYQGTSNKSRFELLFERIA